MRDLRRSGSDILIEEDLAAIFGRHRIVSSVEAHFKDVVKVASFTSLLENREKLFVGIMIRHSTTTSTRRLGLI